MVFLIKWQIIYSYKYLKSFIQASTILQWSKEIEEREIDATSHDLLIGEIINQFVCQHLKII